MTKLLQAIKYELQRQAFGAPVDQPRVVALIERINEELKLPSYVPQSPKVDAVIAAARKAVGQWNYTVGMKDGDPAKGPMNYLADALAALDISLRESKGE